MASAPAVTTRPGASHAWQVRIGGRARHAGPVRRRSTNLIFAPAWRDGRSAYQAPLHPTPSTRCYPPDAGPPNAVHPTKAAEMTQNHAGRLSYQEMLSDPLIRLVMASDGVTVSQFVTVLETAPRRWRRAGKADRRPHPTTSGARTTPSWYSGVTAATFHDPMRTRRRVPRPGPPATPPRSIAARKPSRPGMTTSANPRDCPKARRAAGAWVRWRGQGCDRPVRSCARSVGEDVRPVPRPLAPGAVAARAELPQRASGPSRAAVSVRR